MTIIGEMLGRFQAQTQDEYTLALKEIMQEISLAGLYRAGFFSKAAFYGGTCLRIFHGLDRFSEDLDFSLMNPDPDFSLEPYFQSIITEFASHGVDVSINSKPKTTPSQIESAFLKSNTSIYDLNVSGEALKSFPANPKQLKIKFEADIDPPGNFTTENNLLLHPFSFYVRCYSLPDLFAGKIHALLFRKWKTRVKGRDWFDLEWYIRKGIHVNLAHLNERIIQSGETKGRSFTPEALTEKLRLQISKLNIPQALLDVRPFVKNKESLDIWSKEYFLDLIQNLKVSG